MKHLPFFLILLLTFSAQAEEAVHNHDNSGLMPAKSYETVVSENAPAIYLTMDKSELVRLNNSAASVIVGNPNHASVLMDSPQLLVVVPKAPGATYFSVLDQSGKIILQRHIVVAAPKENYIRVRAAMCGDDECSKTENYYCETNGMCHEISGGEEKKSQSSGGSKNTVTAENMTFTSENAGGSSEE